MQETKKMTLVQLTFIVAVNMMGSGIIMLPTNMAQVGAISLLSWIVTALGSMAIAYGFAQAGIFNQRPGGMSAYAEDGYGRSGYFIVFYLYFLSLAIGNVAIAISAVGYLAAFLPVLASTPVMTTVGVIGLLWLTTVANFGGPKVTGRIGSITVWGVLLPVGALSLIGWFWFSGETFKEAWNPQGLSIGEGMSSSIALTLWAFLGMESAAQNSSAVENPKRDVPLACLFGTLGAAVIYILSTTVIQGIVPNAELANSTGPFGLAYAKMFNPTVGSIVMALAVLACLGSLLGWQFTIAMTGKSAADERMFPQFFTKLNGMGAPVVGMIVMGVVQSLMALSTISPSLSEQFGVLVNLAVVTNVIPYIIALSALPLMMQRAGVDRKKYRMNVAVAVIAMGYSTFALYASGKDAVLGGTIVMAVGFIIWGFIAHRFPPPSAGATGAQPVAGTAAKAAMVLLALSLLGPAEALAQAPAAQGTLERAAASGVIRMGYRTDARPFAFRDNGGNPAGYSVDLCTEVANQLRAGSAGLRVEWVPVDTPDRLAAISEGRVDILCGAETETLARRGAVAFSIPIFPDGISAVVRDDAPARLTEVLSGRQPPTVPNWRASGMRLLQSQKFAAVRGTTGEQWLNEKIREFRIPSEAVLVDDYEAGVQAVRERKAAVFFGDRAILMDAVRRSPGADDLVLHERLFTAEPVALALPRNDDDFRLMVDRTLSGLYASGRITPIIQKWLGAPNENITRFMRWSTLPE